MFQAQLRAGGAAGRWLAGLGIAKAHQLASLFPQARLDSGEVLLDLAEALEIEEAGELQDAEENLRTLIELAREESAAASACNARTPCWVFNARAVAERRNRRRDHELRRLTTDGWKDKLKPRPTGPVKLRYGTRGRRLAASGRPKARAEAETAERARWTDAVVSELRDLQAPSWRQLAGSAEPLRLMRLQLGGRRASTLRMRMREWKRYRVWLRQSRGLDFPEKVIDLVDYMVDRAGEPCTRSSLMGFRASVKFVETVGGYEHGWTDDLVFVNTYNELLAAAMRRRDGMATQQAIPPTMKMMAMMELTVTDSVDDSYDALLAWWGLVSCWAVLRYDDHRGLSPADVTEHTAHWELTFRRTKTTGLDKAVVTRVGVIDKSAWLLKSDWMSKGWGRWSEMAPAARDYFLCPPGVDGSCINREIGYTEYAARLRKMLAGLTDPTTGWILGRDASAVFSPHSFRAVLTSALSALGAGKEQLGWLMAWQTKGSATYVRTGRAMTLRMQSRLGVIVREQWGTEDPIGEGDILAQLADAMGHRGLGATDIRGVISGVSTFTAYQGTQFNLMGEPWRKETSLPPADGPTVTSGSASSSFEAPTEASVPNGTAPTEGFVITTSRKRGLRCLHLLGNCYRQPGIHYHVYEACGTTEPDADRYDQICRTCWPAGQIETSGSEEDEVSESSSTETEGA